MPIPSRRLPKPAGGYVERRRQSVFRVIRACIRGQLAPLSNFPYLTVSSYGNLSCCEHELCLI